MSTDDHRRRDVPSEAHLQDEFAHDALLRAEGVHPRMALSRVHVRIGRRFISVWWLLPGFVLFCVAMVVAFKLFITTAAASSFIRAHPCDQPHARFPAGVSAWQIATHAANFFFMVLIVRAGWQILADHPRLYLRIDCAPDSEWMRFRGPVPKHRVWTAKDDAITLSPLFGLPGGRHTIGVARHWHFIFDILFVLNGVAFIALTFATQHYLKLVPTRVRDPPRRGLLHHPVQRAAPAARGGRLLPLRRDPAAVVLRDRVRRRATRHSHRPGDVAGAG